MGSMRSSSDTGVDAGLTSGPAVGYGRRVRGLLATGCLATLGAMVTTTPAAAAAGAAGVDFEVPAGGESIPVAGIAVFTGFLSLVGVVLAAALLRWSARPAERFSRGHQRPRCTTSSNGRRFSRSMTASGLSAG